jgi:hypothetical protein
LVEAGHSRARHCDCREVRRWRRVGRQLRVVTINQSPAAPTRGRDALPHHLASRSSTPRWNACLLSPQGQPWIINPRSMQSYTQARVLHTSSVRVKGSGALDLFREGSRGLGHQDACVMHTRGTDHALCMHACPLAPTAAPAVIDVMGFPRVCATASRHRAGSQGPWPSQAGVRMDWADSAQDHSGDYKDSMAGPLCACTVGWRPVSS